jgi:hypothetical protein
MQQVVESVMLGDSTSAVTHNVLRFIVLYWRVTLHCELSTRVSYIVCFGECVQCVWYWGALGFDEAEAKLADKPDGTFLVRDSSDDRYILSLSFRSLGATHHTRIEHYKGQCRTSFPQTVNLSD